MKRSTRGRAGARRTNEHGSRLVALRTSLSVPRAAERLGMAPVSLSRWPRRRKLPLRFED